MKRPEQTAELAQSLLESGWMLRLRVSGSSMKPLVRSGSLLRIAPLSPLSPPSRPSPLSSLSGAPILGDIVLFRATSGRLVAHRVIGSDGETYRTKGDSAGESDGPVERRQLLGKILGIEGPLFLPLDGPVARRIGLLLNRHYPRLVRLKTALKRRFVETAPNLAGEGS